MNEVCATCRACERGLHVDCWGCGCACNADDAASTSPWESYPEGVPLPEGHEPPEPWLA